jgi:hypothetical protein
MGSPPDEPPVKLLDQMSIESPQAVASVWIDALVSCNQLPVRNCAP